MDWTKILQSGAELDGGQVVALCDSLFDATIPVETRGEWLAALAAKGETAREIAVFVQTLLKRAERLPALAGAGGTTIDVCGTGGDKLGLFNISTAVMFVVAASGLQVVKHGNRGITSKSGGADVLEAAGVRIDLDPPRAAEVLAEVGCVFLFAPRYHPTFRAVGPVRQRLAEQGIVTIFNKLGPLLNPAMPSRQLAGVYQENLVPLYAEVFAELGRERAWAVHGRTLAGGMDELSTMGSCQVSALEDGRITSFELDARDFGIPAPHPAELLGGDGVANAAVLRRLLEGKHPGAIEDMVCWNAAAALVVGGECPDLHSGLELSRRLLNEGAAVAKFEAMRAASVRLAS
jgi:anthranilate phosphoribosyltransferase